MTYTRAGSLLGAEIGTSIDERGFFLRIEATPVIAAVIQSMGWRVEYVGPAQDSGRLWFLVPYTREIDEWLTQVVDLAADLRQARPGFGQLGLGL